MRIAVVAVAVVFAALCALTTLFESDEAARRAAEHFTPEEIARGRTYSFQRRLLFWGRAASAGGPPATHPPAVERIEAAQRRLRP